MSTTNEDCDACDGTAYLLDQTYGNADIPNGWTPVQACDNCHAGRNADDEKAAMFAANERDEIDHPVYYAYFPGGWDDENDEALPGDWAIGPGL